MALSNAEREQIRKFAANAVEKKNQGITFRNPELEKKTEEAAVPLPSADEVRRQQGAASTYSQIGKIKIPDSVIADAMAKKAESEYERLRKDREGKNEKNVPYISKGAETAGSGSYAAGLQAQEVREQTGAETDEERAAKAKAEHYRQQATRYKEQELMDRDMKEFESWPEEDRAALETYIIESDREKYDWMGEPSFDSARYNAAELFNKYGAQKVAEIAESYTRYKNAQTNREVSQAAQEGAGSGVLGAIGHSAATIGANVAGAVTAPLGYLGEIAGRTGRYSTMDPNNVGGIFNTYSDAVRSQVASDIEGEDGNGVRKALSYGYQGVMSAADSLARVALGGGNKVVSLGLAASGSFGRTMSEASGQGASPAQAVALATAKSFLEVGTEYIPLDNLLKTAKGGAQTAGKAIMNALKQGGMEIIEEEASFLGSLAAEAAILQEKRGYKQQIGELIANGMSYQQAREQAIRTLWNEAVDTLIVSGISGGVSSLGASYAANQQSKPDTRTAEQKRFDGIHQAIGSQLHKRGLKQENITESPTYEALTAKKDITVVDVGTNTEGKTYAQLKKDVMNKAEQQKWYDSPHINEDTGMPVFLTRQSFTHAFSNLTSDFGTDTILAMGNVPELIQNAVLTHVDPPKNPRKTENRVFTLFAAINGENGVEPVKLKVKEYNVNNASMIPQNILNYFNRIKAADKYNTLYDLKALEVVEIESAKKEFDASANVAEQLDHSGARGTPNSTIRVADLLGLVKGDAAKYIPQAYAKNDTDVLRNEDGRAFEAMGAASLGFSPFSRMQMEYGNIPEGENPVRSDDMPISTDGNDRVSYTARTVKGAAATPDEFVPLLEQRVVGGGMSYIPITNNQTTQAAIQTIMNEGWSTARAHWTAEVEKGIAGDQITAIGALLYNNAVNKGEYKEAMDILMDYQVAVRNSARGLQAARILKTLSPENRLYMIRRSVERMAKDMHLDGEITIDEDLANAYQNAETDEEADAILSQIQEDVASQIPSTAPDKWTALRYMNMLGNFRTQVRNVAGNIGAQLTYRMKDQIAAGLEAIASAASGGKLERTKSFIVNRDMKQLAKADFEDIKSAVMGSGKYTDSQAESGQFAQEVQDKRRIFKNPVLEGYRKTTNWAMNNRFFGDEAFSRAAYSRAMAGYLQANGVTAESFESADEQLMDRARRYAIQEAQEATFRDSNQFSDWISQAARRKVTWAPARVVAEGIMPFRRTPANVLLRAEEYSPLGLLNSAYTTIQAARGKATGADVINSWSKTLTGSGLVLLGAFLGDMGILIGGPDEDEDKAEFDELTGYQNYALQLPDGTNLTIDFLSPAAMPLFMGAQWNKIREDKDIQWSELETAMLSLADPMIQMSMLQGVNDTLDNIKYSEDNIGQFLLNAATNYLTQGLTNTLLGQIERSGEESRMTTYVDKSSDLSPWLQRQLGKISQKVPGWDYQQTPYVNAWGEEEESFEGVYNYLYNMFSPAYISKAETSALTDELYRLNQAQSETNVFPSSPESTLNFTGADGTEYKDFVLSADVYVKLEKAQGQTAKDILLDLIADDGYKVMTDSQKAEAVGLVYSYAREKARTEAIEEYPGMSKAWMENISGKETETIINKVVSESVTDALSSVNEAIDNDWNTAEAAENLEQAYDVYKEMNAESQEEIAENAGGNMWKYLAMRDSGVTTEQYIDLNKLVAGLKIQNGYKTVRDIQKAEAVASFPGLSESERTAVMKLYLSDAQDTNLDQMQKMGFDVADYMAAWKIYDSESGKGKKARTIEQYQSKFGVDEETAKAIYEIYG